jgi:hypothetical protein
MERVSFNYSTKNIPLPSQSEYNRKLIEKTELLCRRMRWRAYFFLNPPTSESQKGTYGFKSRKTPSQIPEMINFENRLLYMNQKVKFRKVNCDFQRQLSTDIHENIRRSETLLVAADKTNNFYKMKAAAYSDLLHKNITKSYRKANPDSIISIEAEAKTIATKLALDDRINITAKREAFITLKDHKPNLDNKPTCRLINPTKSEIGKISKHIYWTASTKKSSNALTLTNGKILLQC